MKVVQRNVTIMVWCCTIAIGLFLILMKDSTAVSITAGMTVVSIVTTLLYFAPVSDRFKAIAVLLIIGLGTLAVGIMLGGNGGTFIASFIVLGMALLYFDPVVLIVYAGIYLTVCIIVFCLQPVLVFGSSIAPFLGKIEIITYAIITGCLSFGTNYGRKLMIAAKKDEMDANENVKIIQSQGKAANENSAVLYDHIVMSDETVKSLSGDVTRVNESIQQLNLLEQDTMQAFGVLNVKINAAMDWIHENYQMIEQLKENSNTSLDHVKQSKEFSSVAQNAIGDIFTTIEHANDSILQASEEISKIAGIIQNMNAIATQTNLLATNAAIEAARADQQGSGFAIVAEQIRALSVQSKQASENMNTILEKLLIDLTTTESKINNGRSAIGRGITHLNTVLKEIDRIAYYSNQSQVTLNQEIDSFEEIKKEFAIMVQEVERSNSLAELNMKDLKAVSEVIQSQTKQTMSVSDHLAEMKTLANEVTNQFTSNHEMNSVTES